MTNNGFVQRLDQLIQAKSLLTHPFYRAWQEGRLTVPMLRQYATQYYHNEAAFPIYLSAIHTKCDSLPVRQLILSNLWDEEHGDKNHPELWLRFCDALGLEREQVKRADLFPETAALIQTYRHITGRRSVAEGLAAMYAYEWQVPAIAQTKVEGLERFYGIADPQSVEFFTVHMQADVEHSGAEAQIIADYATTPKAQAKVEASLNEALDAQWRFLDGVCRACGV